MSKKPPVKHQVRSPDAGKPEPEQVTTATSPPKRSRGRPPGTGKNQKAALNSQIDPSGTILARSQNTLALLTKANALAIKKLFGNTVVIATADEQDTPTDLDGVTLKVDQLAQILTSLLSTITQP